MDVVDPDQAAVAEDAGAVAVMALERVPADIRRDGGVARMSHPDMIQGILDCTSIPVMAKSRIGHEGEARILESMGVDMLTNLKCSHPLTRSSTSKRKTTTFHSSAVQPGLGKPSAEFTKAQQ